MKSLKFDGIKIAKVLDAIDEGKFALPHLQRRYVWKSSHVCRFLDSIYRGMPVGSLVIWRTDQSARSKLRLNHEQLGPLSRHAKDVWVLLDGQQRVTTLHMLRLGGSTKNEKGRLVDFSKIHFYPNSASSESRTFGTHASENSIPVYDLLHKSWRRRTGGLNKKQRAECEKARRAILHHELGMLAFSSNDDVEIQEAFIRINAAGVPLTKADKLFAKISNIRARDQVSDIISHLDEHFRDIKVETILLAYSFFEDRPNYQTGEKAMARIEKRWSSRLTASQVSSEKKTREWKMLQGSIEKSIDHLRHHFKIHGIDDLPSENMCAVLASYFMRHRRRASPHAKEQIKRWFWATAVKGRYSGTGSQANISADVKFFSALAKSHRNLRFQFDNPLRRSELSRKKYQARGSALMKAFVCLLRKNRAADFSTGELLPENWHSAANRESLHHIFPRARMKKMFPADVYDSLCNLCLIRQGENSDISDQLPSEYLFATCEKKKLKKVLRSQLIPSENNSALGETSSSELKKSFPRFLKEREALIAEAFNREAGIKVVCEDW